MYFCWSRWLFFAVVAGLALLSMLSGCGLKGPLYLPTEPVAEPVQAQESVAQDNNRK
ncbi:MAG: lipoprotein [Gammaproteobacteria bacterium]|nr:lipoprotein [Gammaproteobacteria bacterium]